MTKPKFHRPTNNCCRSIWGRSLANQLKSDQLPSNGNFLPNFIECGIKWHQAATSQQTSVEMQLCRCRRCFSSTDKKSGIAFFRSNLATPLHFGNNVRIQPTLTLYDDELLLLLLLLLHLFLRTDNYWLCRCWLRCNQTYFCFLVYSWMRREARCGKLNGKLPCNCFQRSLSTMIEVMWGFRLCARCSEACVQTGEAHGCWIRVLAQHYLMNVGNSLSIWAA